MDTRRQMQKNDAKNLHLKKQTKQKFYTYEFTIRLIGGGKDPEEAWNNLMDEGVLQLPDADSYGIPNPTDIKVVGEEEQS